MFVEAMATKSFFSQNKNLTKFLKHPNDNQLGNDISVLSSSHHAKQCLPYFAAAGRERETEGVKDENDSGERSRTE